MPQAAVIDMLVFYIKTARARAVVHINSSIVYNKLNRTFSLPAIIVTGIAGPLELMISASPYLNPVILISTCVLLSIQGVFKFAVKGEQHETASRDLYSLALHIETEMALKTTDRAKLLKDITKRFNEIVKQSPAINDHAVKQALVKVMVNINPQDTVVNIAEPGSTHATDATYLNDSSAVPILVAFDRKKQEQATALQSLACNEPFNPDTDKDGNMEFAANNQSIRH